MLNKVATLVFRAVPSAGRRWAIDEVLVEIILTVLYTGNVFQIVSGAGRDTGYSTVLELWVPMPALWKRANLGVGNSKDDGHNFGALNREDTAVVSRYVSRHVCVLVRTETGTVQGTKNET